MHVDTGHNFPEVLEFRDRTIAELEVELIVEVVDDSTMLSPDGFVFGLGEDGADQWSPPLFLSF